jgi:hypothetical protein
VLLEIRVVRPQPCTAHGRDAYAPGVFPWQADEAREFGKAQLE